MWPEAKSAGWLRDASIPDQLTLLASPTSQLSAVMQRPREKRHKEIAEFPSEGPRNDSPGRAGLRLRSSSSGSVRHDWETPRKLLLRAGSAVPSRRRQEKHVPSNVSGILERKNYPLNGINRYKYKLIDYLLNGIFIPMLFQTKSYMICIYIQSRP